MIRVTSFPSMTPAHIGPANEVSSYVKGTTILQTKFLHYELFSTKDPIFSEPSELRGYFREGPLAPWDDRDCFHVKYDGDIVVDDYLRSPTELERAGYMNADVYHTQQLQIYTRLVSPSQPFYDFLQYYPKLSNVLWEYHARAYMDGDCAYWGYLRKEASKPTGTILWYRWKFNAMNGRFSSSSSQVISNATVEQFLAGSPLVPTTYPNIAPTIFLAGGNIGAHRTDFRILNRLLVEEATKAVPVDDNIYGELAMEAINSIRFVDSNMLQFVAELGSVNKVVQGLIPKSLDTTALASSYLTKQYGVDTTISDIESIFEGLKRTYAQSERMRTRAIRAGRSFTFGSGGIVEYHYKVVYGYYPSALLNFMRKLDEWSLLPNFTIAWDLVPMSFVFDWFANVDELLKQIDFRTRYQMYDIKGVTKSRKYITYVTERRPWLGMVLNNVKVIQYHRITERELTLPQFGYVPPDEFRNVAELTALLVANKGRK